MSKMKIVVTGASGFVAGSVLYHGAQDHEIHAVSRGACMYEHPSVQWHSLDLMDHDGLAKLFHEIHPDAVIHVAAIADIDFCENNRDEAYAVNVDYTRRLAELAEQVGARMVFVSTDNVFDGKAVKNTEKDAVAPVNYYGHTKVEAEKSVFETVTNAAVGRLALVMGFPIVGGGNSFLMRMIAQWEEGNSVGVPENEFRSPIDLVTVGKALVELAANDVQGVVLLGGLDTGPRIEVVKKLAEGFGYDPSMVHPFDPRQLPGRGARPETVIFDVQHAQSVLDTPMVHLEQAIELMKPFQ